MCLSDGAGGGIRTPEPYGPAYKAGAFDHSATPAKLRSKRKPRTYDLKYALSFAT